MPEVIWKRPEEKGGDVTFVYTEEGGPLGVLKELQHLTPRNCALVLANGQEVSNEVWTAFVQYVKHLRGQHETHSDPDCPSCSGSWPPLAAYQRGGAKAAGTTIS